MVSTFRGLSVSQENTPVEVRELFSLNQDACKSVLLALREELDITEALIVSTCNRTEVYYTSDFDHNPAIIEIINRVTGNAFSEYLKYFRFFFTTEDSIRHLFEVSAGLRSQVLGDLQIGGQVKDAYQWSADLQMAGPFVHRLMHTIFFTNKRIVQETSFRDGAASVSYAAAELADDLSGSNKQTPVLLLGIGEMGADAAKNLADMGYENISICNRTIETANTFAESLPGVLVKVYPLEKLVEAIQSASIIISAVQVEKPIITCELLKNTEVLTHKFFIDLSVPRSVDSQLENMPGMIVYNMDDITRKTNEALESRRNSVPKVKLIVEEQIGSFFDWTREMIMSPVIQKLHASLETIRQEELSRYNKQLTEDHVKMVDAITKSMIQKIIKLPVLQLKAACKRGEAETLIDVLNDLFDLEKARQEQH